jgi:hypothetical protein
MNKNILKQLIMANIYAKRGFSVNVKGQSPTEGYLSGFNTGELIRPVNEFLVSEVDAWVEKYWEQLQDANLYAGGWLDNGLYYLEISRHIGGEIPAKDFGRKHNQIAIFDVVAGESIYLEPQTVTGGIHSGVGFSHTDGVIIR